LDDTKKKLFATGLPLLRRKITPMVTAFWACRCVAREADNGLVLIHALHEVRLTGSTGKALFIFRVCRAAFRVDLRFQIVNFNVSFFLFL
jgi:hypothetical protein